MKILAFTDFHSDFPTIRKIARKAKDADIAVCCGDMTFFGHELEKVLNFLSKSMNIPIFFIHGNHDDEKESIRLSKKCKNLIPIHLRLAKVSENLYIFGFGGGGFSYTEPILEKAIKKVKEKLPKKARLILVTHAPPYNTELDFLDEERGHHGCNSGRKFIQKLKPVLALSGHFHETFYLKDKLNETILLNPGDEGTIIEIEN